MLINQEILNSSTESLISQHEQALVIKTQNLDDQCDLEISDNSILVIQNNSSQILNNQNRSTLSNLVNRIQNCPTSSHSLAYLDPTKSLVNEKKNMNLRERNAVHKLKNADLQVKNTAYQEKILTLESENKDLKQRYKTLEEIHSNLKTKHAILELKHTNFKTSHTNLKTQISESKKKIKELDNKYIELQIILAKRVEAELVETISDLQQQVKGKNQRIEELENEKLDRVVEQRKKNNCKNNLQPPSDPNWQPNQFIHQFQQNNNPNCHHQPIYDQIQQNNNNYELQPGSFQTTNISNELPDYCSTYETATANTTDINQIQVSSLINQVNANATVFISQGRSKL
ncbi:9130_t:CDS:2, partial [Cetraspora pellucida]